MILFICPSCEERFVLSTNQIQNTTYLSCEKCKRVVPCDLIDSLKTVFKYFPQQDQLGQHNPQNWTIEISKNDILK